MGLKSFTSLALGTLANKLTSCVLHSASWMGSSGSLSCMLAVSLAFSLHLHFRAAASGVAAPGMARHQHTPSVRLPIVAPRAFRQVHTRGVGPVSAATPTDVAAPGLAKHQHTTSGITVSTNDTTIPSSTCTVLLVLLLEVPSRIGKLHESRIGLVVV